MAWYEGLGFGILFAYIIGNIVCTIIFFKTMNVDETVIDNIWDDSDMNIFGKILSSILAFIMFPLIHIICYGFRFIYWITHVKVGKEKNKYGE